MKALKVILLVVLTLVALVFVVSFILPTDYRVERSITIEAPEQLVEDQVRYFQNFVQWNPWKDFDPNLSESFEGTDGEVGARYSWTGNGDVGTGYMENTLISENRVEQNLVFTAPWTASDKTWYEWTEVNNGVQLTWGMEGSMARPMNIMTLFMNMEEMIGANYDTGLARVKEIAETKAAEAAQAAAMEEEIMVEEL